MERVRSIIEAMTRAAIVVTAAALALGTAGLARAPEESTDGVVAGLESWLAGTRTLAAHFRQTLVSGALGTSATEQGRLYLERPGKLRWDYAEPDPKIALLLGDHTFLYLEDDRQYVRGRLGLDQALFPRLLAGRERVGDLFRARLTATPRSGGHGDYKLRLTPADAPAGLAVVTLTLAPPEFSILAAEVVDAAGNRTVYALDDLVRNRPLPDGIFGFEPPPGTEIVDQP